MFSSWFNSPANNPPVTLRCRVVPYKKLIRLFVLPTTGSSSSTPFSTPRQPLPPPLSLPPLSGTQSSHRSPQTTRRQVRSSLMRLKLSSKPTSVASRRNQRVPVRSSWDGDGLNSSSSPVRCDALVAFALNVHNGLFFCQLLVSHDWTQHPEKNVMFEGFSVPVCVA